MKKKDLNFGYGIFGNKGNVWSNMCHIHKYGESTTLCGVPMLSTNWAELEKIDNVGCKDCKDKYLFNEKTKK